MKRILALSAALAMMALSAPLVPAFAVDNSISPLCRAGAPEAYSRPGGYCEQVASNKSLLVGKNSQCPDGGQWDDVLDMCVCTKS